MERKSGVLMHVSSLFGEYSSGSFGKEAKEWIDFLAECSFTYWQVLPFCPIDECNSPYKSYSTFAGNPYFVDLTTLYEKGLISQQQLDSQRQITPYSCEFGRLYNERFPVLMQASKNVKNRSEIEAYIAANPYLEAFCKFAALKQANQQQAWYTWENQDYDPDVLFLWKFIQYEFFTQWAEIKKYANDRHIKIIGDIPFYVALDSADVWSSKEMFLLDEENVPTFVAGVPPDYFSEDGQLWGNPLYNWDRMQKDGYQWWTDRIRHNLTLFDGIRLDHFRAVESYWAVPYGESTAKNGKWFKGPGMDFIQAIQKAVDGKLIIAEDLGDITQDVINLVEESGFPGMRVFQFGFFSEADSPHKPHSYINNCVAYSGTHDNNTLLGYLWELDEHTRKFMLEYCGFTDTDWNKGYDAMLRALYASSAGLVIFPIQDLLGYGSDTRLNIPGQAHGNWQFRITRDQLQSIDKGKFRRLNALYNR